MLKRHEPDCQKSFGNVYSRLSKGCPNMLKKSFIGVLLCAMMLVIIGGVVGAQDKTEITYMM